ncbi:MAG: hypothetical protein BGP00_03185 [Novosphingobium sp. 63-713]|uniref:hypothetical protein n=1 Tax=unclassified Novosphingobium TaxID=2644732 RepID=UPI00086E8D5D|nr:MULTISPECIES: hypothetical protein [unclassified Novosphingobium]MBN9145069.1 hypothetical protein [Novosphingobium sp.]MDR6708990.1 hypothetical protein [Novosphingobium sp. 1748]ODU70974.1 MAG: hypothetical protein ABT11_05325 [Novosphingobium sp. SCN 66-18]OJX89925.1 MAG: hypothetical protein BGP00_03185 [Novosphingobium sp. 63-713]
MAATPAPARAPALSINSLLLLAVTIRLAAHFALPQPLQSDGLAYFTLAQTMADGEWPVDNLGQHAFYSIGYPLVLAPFFALLGASAGVAFGVNLALALATGGLIVLLAREAGLSDLGRKLALLGYALWLPGIWNCTMLARENLSTPLLVAVVWLALRLLRSPSSLGLAAATGAVWGAAMLAGTSALPLIAAPLLALVLGGSVRRAVVPALAMGMGAALVLAPWAMATQAMLGRPTLSTNTGFNLYIGNNPVATGRFVSIAATPIGPQWHALRENLGEAGASAALGAMARDWMAHHPAEVARLAAVKLAAFWAPNLPDSNDFALSPAVTYVRLFEVVQYLLFLTLAGLCLLLPGIERPRQIVVMGAITGFWALHGVAYIIDRYRDPVMPLLIVMASAALAEIVTNRLARRESPHAA